MFNPVEMFQVPGGAGMDAMARQFGLTVEQTQRAMAALMPALTLGLQRGAADPTGFARLFGMAAGMAPEPARAPAGSDPLGQMLGSAQLMQGVLQQASAASGVGAQVLRQMLPMMAGTVVASIVHVMLNPPQPAEGPRQAAPPPPVPFPFAPAWAEMARAFLPQPAAPAPPPPPETPAPTPGADMMGQMFRTGAEMQEKNLRAMQELFEAFWPAKSGASEAGSGTPPTPGRPSPRGRGRGPTGA